MTSKVLLLVAFLAGCGFTFFSAIKRILLDEH